MSEAITWPEPSYAVHFHGFGPLANGNAKNLAPPTVTRRNCVVLPSGLVTMMRATDLPALPTATAGTPSVRNITPEPSPAAEVARRQLLAPVPPVNDGNLYS